ncbi:MAG: hypothetical protein V4484_19125 [Pseudomonadota bacterium]
MRALSGDPLRTPPRRWVDALAVLACIAFALAVTWWHGVDRSWDLLNYHIYSGYALMHGRLPSEFMEAGMVSYLNPLPMLPFYGMLAADWHSLSIGMVLALVHSLNLVLLWMICRRLFGTRHLALPFSLVALLVGAASPIFIAEIGTSYADISTCIPVLGAIFLLLGAPTRGHLLAAGALLGAAAGLKLTNLLFAVAAVVFLFAPEMSWRQRGANLGWLVLGGLVGSALTGGYWAWLLYSEYHNPFFPFANSVFHSPDFPAVSFTHRRFLSSTLGDALALPFYLAIPKEWIYAEVFAPDLRFAMCFAALAALGFVAVRRRFAHGAATRQADESLWLRFLGFIVLSWTLWLLQFSNGRYFLPLSLLIGPALAIVPAFMLSAPRALLVACVCALLQLGNMNLVGVFTFGGSAKSEKWTRHWINFDNLPQKLVDQPYLYLGLDRQSYSYLAAYVHPQSRFVNVDGMVPLDLVGPGSERIKQQLARFPGATRMLRTISDLSPATALADPRFASAIDADLNRFGLRMDSSDCAPIVNGDQFPRTTTVANTPHSGKRRPVTVLSCALVATAPDPALQAARKQSALLFDKIEHACPDAFPTRWNGIVTRGRDSFSWTRYYVDTDLTLSEHANQVYVEHNRLGMHALGTPEGLRNGSEPVRCDWIRWHDSPTPRLKPD